MLAISSAPSNEQYLIFRLRESLYAVPALAVREIHALPALTPLGETAPWMAGVVNLRGSVVPAMNLALRLGHAREKFSRDDSLVVLQWESEIIALIVDEVRDVLAIPSAQIEAPPQFGQLERRQENLENALVSGIAKIPPEVVTVLNLAALLQAPPDFPGGQFAGQSATETAYAADFEAKDKAIFGERARRLMPPIEAQIGGEMFPMALIKLGGETFGIALNGVREFCNVRHAAAVPCCPPHIVGQMNLRGDIVTLLDIGPLLQMPPRRETSGCKVVIVQHEDAPVGLVVDDVLDVLYLHAQDLVEADSPDKACGGKYFSGGARQGEQMLCVLDTSRILTEGDLAVDEAI